MKYLFIISILIQFALSDTIIIEYHSLFNTETIKIENVEYLGITENKLIAYKYYDSDTIYSRKLEDISKIYDNDDNIIDFKNISYANLKIEELTPARAKIRDKKNFRFNPTPAALSLIGAGICHILKADIRSELHEFDFDSPDDLEDKIDKIKNLDKIEGALILISGISLFINANQDKNKNINYSINPLNKNSLLNLSIKF